MRIITKKPPTKAILITIASVLLVGAAGYAYVSYSNSLWPFMRSNENTKSEDDKKNIDLLPPTDEQVNNGYSNKEEIIKGEEQGNTADDNKEGSSKKENLTVTITNFRRDGANIVAGAIVNTQTPGECTATLKKAGQLISTIKGTTVMQSSYLSCVDLNLPTNSTSGPYTLTVHFSNDKQEGSMTQDVNL